MKFGQSESKYLKKEDLENGQGGYRQAVVTVESVGIEEMERPNGDSEKKFIAYFQGKAKGLVLNQGNQAVLIDLAGDPPASDPAGLTNHFRGTRVVITVDPNVRYAGKRVGGLVLLRPAPQQPASPPMTGTTSSQPPPPAAQPQQPEGEWGASAPEPGDDSIPF